jgi:CRISPR-associated protein Cmr3
LILARDELSGWFGGFGAYKGGSGSDVATWLEMYGGRAYFTDRVGRGSIKVPRSSVSVSGTIQPITFSAILKPEFRANGMLARFLLAAPPRKKKVWDENGIPDQTVKDWKKLVWHLLELADEKELRLSSEAKDLWVPFYNGINDGICNLTTQSSDETAAWSKLEGYCARLALVLQMVANVSGGGSSERIEAPAMQTAIKLIDWFKAETNRVYSLMKISARKSTDENLLAFIRSRGGQVTVRDVSQNYRPLKNKEEEIGKKFSELAKNGYGTVEQQGKSTVFKLN